MNTLFELVYYLSEEQGKRQHIRDCKMRPEDFSQKQDFANLVKS